MLLKEMDQGRFTPAVRRVVYVGVHVILANVRERVMGKTAVAALGKCQPKNISNWLLGDITRIINEKNLILADTKLSAEKLADMLAMIETGEISTTAGKTVLEEIIFSDKTAADVVEEKGLRQMNDTGALEQVVSDILAANPKVVEDYRGGKTNALGFLVGQCMRASKGKGNPNILREMLEKALNS